VPRLEHEQILQQLSVVNQKGCVTSQKKKGEKQTEQTILILRQEQSFPHAAITLKYFKARRGDEKNPVLEVKGHPHGNRDLASLRDAA
jgi:hypothetical protein